VNIETIDLNLFVVLHHVLSERSVARAADRLNVTPSAVSNSLARLRQIVGDPLLVRRGRTVVPTPRAQELAPQVAAAIARFRSALEGGAQFRADTCVRRFTIASADNIGVGILPRIVERFSRVFPRSTLRVVTLDHAVASDGLASGDLDVLLGLPPTMPPEYRSEPAYTERLVCALSRDNPIAGRKLTLRRFLDCRHIEVALQGRYPIDYVDTVLSRLGRSRTIALSVPQFTMAAMCVAGTYITMLPASMAKPLASFLPLTLAEPPFALPPITILQVWHARTDVDPASKVLRTIIREAGTDGRSRDALARTRIRAARAERLPFRRSRKRSGGLR
jgi:DNA-binding transcriptional LysR family regulator